METEEGPGDEIKALIEKNKHLQSQLSQYEEDFKHEREDRIRATEARDRIEKEFKDYKEANEVQLTQLNNRVEEMALKLLHAEELPRKKKGKSKKELQTALGENERLRRERNGLSTRIADLESQVDSYKKRLHATRKEYDSALKSWKSLENNTSTTEEVMKEATQKLHIRLNEAVMELEAAKEEIAVKVAQVKQYQKQVEAYKQQLEQNNEQTQAFRQQLDHMSKLKEQAEKRLTTEAVRGSDTKKPMDLEFKPSFCSGTPIAASPFSISEEDRVTGIGTSLRAVRGNDLDTDLDTGLGNIVSPHTCLPAPVAGMQQHPLSAPPTGSDRVPSPRIFSPQPPPHAGPPSLDNLPHQSAMGGSQGIAYPTLDQHQDEHVGSGEPTAPPDPNLTCPQCRLVFKKGEIQKFRLHVQECKHSK